MARPLRMDMAGGWYHLTSRGNEKEQRELRALKKRPTWKSVVGAVEAVKG